MTDTIPFRAVQPKRPWRVAKLGGGHRTFASVVKASEFACLQASQAWARNQPWTIINTADGRVWLAYENGDVEQVQ